MKLHLTVAVPRSLRRGATLGVVLAASTFAACAEPRPVAADAARHARPPAPGEALDQPLDPQMRRDLEELGYLAGMDEEDFVRCVRDYVAERARLDPEWGTAAGLHDGDGLLTHYDDASWDRRRRLNTSTLARLRAIDAERLSPDNRIDLTLLRSQLRSADYEYERQDAREVGPGIALGAIGSINSLLIRDFAPKAVRVDNAIARLRQVPLICAELIARLQHPPELWTRMAIEDVGGALTFLDGVPELAGPAPDLREALDAARAALDAYRGFLQNELLPRSDGSFALGRPAFEFHLQNDYLLSLSADELLALGKAQFDTTIALLDETARRIDPSRGWRAILAEMMDAHPTAGNLMDTYRTEVAHARQYLIDHAVVAIPDEKLQILETPAFMRSTTPFAAYDSPAPLDESRLGTFYVTPEPEAHILADIPGTVWHEAYPGHHLQLVYAKDNASLVRRLNGSALLSEGWGFYCEELAHETGYYDDPRERLMQLNWRLQRAARVILDVSVHAFGMSWDDAVAFLVEQVGMLRPQAERSVNAYTQSPTYFSSYMLGMLEIVRIREEFRARLGPRFSLAEFHGRLLRCGNVPPALIEEELLRTWR